MKLKTQTLPLYTRGWNQLKQFPHVLSQGAAKPPSTSGSAVAALVSGGIGAVTMMITHHLSDTHKPVESFLHHVIGAWIPGAVNDNPLWGNIGSYAGKETLLLVGWLGSWVILHMLLKDRHIQARTIFIWMFSLFTLATAMAWHPLFPYLPLM